jgi:flagellar basal body-associated protein FliL
MTRTPHRETHRGKYMELQIVVIVIAVVGLLVGGTVFTAWRAERAEDKERDQEPDRSA